VLGEYREGTGGITGREKQECLKQKPATVQYCVCISSEEMLKTTHMVDTAL
jgi:hypothetical protein